MTDISAIRHPKCDVLNVLIQAVDFFFTGILRKITSSLTTLRSPARENPSCWWVAGDLRASPFARELEMFAPHLNLPLGASLDSTP